MIKKSYEGLLFVDIETASAHKNLMLASDQYKDAWIRKVTPFGEEPPSFIDAAKKYSREASLYAEFGRIVAISMGMYMPNKKKFSILGIGGSNEARLLEKAKSIIEQSFKGNMSAIIAHNGIEFDYPYLAKRMVINSIALPPQLMIAGRKPWEYEHLMDTYKIWSHTGWKKGASLAALAAVFNIPSPKDDIDGSQVSKEYYLGNIQRIVEYCNKDVKALAEIYCRMSFEAMEETTFETLMV